jgi:hypothetical protein
MVYSKGFHGTYTPLLPVVVPKKERANQAHPAIRRVSLGMKHTLNVHRRAVIQLRSVVHRGITLIVAVMDAIRTFTRALAAKRWAGVVN